VQSKGEQGWTALRAATRCNVHVVSTMQQPTPPHRRQVLKVPHRDDHIFLVHRSAGC